MQTSRRDKLTVGNTDISFPSFNYDTLEINVFLRDLYDAATQLKQGVPTGSPLIAFSELL